MYNSISLRTLKVLVLDGVGGGDALLGTVIKHPVQQPITSFGGPPGKFLFQIIIRLVFEVDVLDQGEFGVARPDRLVRTADRVNNLVDQLDLAPRRKKRRVQKQLGQNTPKQPT